MSQIQTQNPASSYRNFKLAIYVRVYEVRQMADPAWMAAQFAAPLRHMRVSKVYLETHRDMIVADAATLNAARQFLESRGVQVAGGITVTVNERNRFETYCYTNPEHRRKLKEVVAYTAGLFDEIILDDFFFTNCKCPACIAAKGDRSWTEFRLALMANAALDLVIEPARAVKPDIKVVIKYPNWYEHFQGLGFNLEAEPPLFDGLYTGTETRDPLFGNQHLQPYHGYLTFRYFENLKPGCNGGGWVDPWGSRYLDRYIEQFWLTLFAKAPELTLFELGQMQRPLEAAWRAPWEAAAPEDALGTGVAFDALIAPVRRSDGTWPAETKLPLAIGYALEQVDAVLGELGAPLGLKSYKPYHSSGEDFLHGYLGMLGIPLDLVPEFPAGAPIILLTESAKADPDIVDKIERQLRDGKTVVVTSGLFRALQGRNLCGRGIRDIVELEVTDRKASVQDFQIGWFETAHADAPVLIPHLAYLTNDSWEEISGVTRTTGHPLLHQAGYAGGRLFVWVIPDNFDDLNRLPEPVLARIRAVLLQDLPVRVNGPAQIMLFVYDNDTFIVESFLDEPAPFQIIVGDNVVALHDLQTGAVLRDGQPLLDWRQQPTGEVSFAATIRAHSYCILRMERVSESAGKRIGE
ncbi:MAG: hypothetical protein JXA21_07075 [Anaerolineae bacterium]|nr:hypothetical protein [Anaerolineae bacterium]